MSTLSQESVDVQDVDSEAVEKQPSVTIREWPKPKASWSADEQVVAKFVESYFLESETVTILQWLGTVSVKGVTVQVYAVSTDCSNYWVLAPPMCLFEADEWPDLSAAIGEHSALVRSICRNRKSSELVSEARSLAAARAEVRDVEGVANREELQSRVDRGDANSGYSKHLVDVLSRRGEGLSGELLRHLRWEDHRLALRHPLAIDIDYWSMSDSQYNIQVEGKRGWLEKAEAERDWHTYAFLHERPYRFGALRRIDHRLADAEYWSLLHDVYTDAEFPYQHGYVPSLFRKKRKCKDRLMDEGEQALFRRLPGEFVVYRGINDPVAQMGLSWTLRYATASWFAHRFDGQPQVVRAWCRKKDVHCLLLGRGECEVVVEPTKLRDIEVVAPPTRPHWLEDLWALCKQAKVMNDPKGRVHGPAHWEGVEFNVCRIAETVSGADLDVAMAFAALHDCQRRNDNHDPEHGPRAAAFAQELHRAGRLPLSVGQLKKLVYACRHHTDGATSKDPTVGACWDADRLDLIRVGIVPDRRFFSTEKAFDAAFRVSPSHRQTARKVERQVHERNDRDV